MWWRTGVCCPALMEVVSHFLVVSVDKWQIQQLQSLQKHLNLSSYCKTQPFRRKKNTHKIIHIIEIANSKTYSYEKTDIRKRIFWEIFDKLIWRQKYTWMFLHLVWICVLVFLVFVLNISLAHDLHKFHQSEELIETHHSLARMSLHTHITFYPRNQIKTSELLLSIRGEWMWFQHETCSKCSEITWQIPIKSPEEHLSNNILLISENKAHICISRLQNKSQIFDVCQR